MNIRWALFAGMFALTAVALPDAWAQSPDGPMIPQPGVPIQQGPPSPIKIRTVLVNTPVTVRNEKGEMVHDLEESDFRITDNGAPQKITHFNLGGDEFTDFADFAEDSQVGNPDFTDRDRTDRRRRHRGI